MPAREVTAPSIEQTTNYALFVLMDNNRNANRGHIDALKKEFEENGNLTQVQPILVNERMQIIDGQHRYIAAMELGQPIFYTRRDGLTIGDARRMNILHRSWNVDDFARSYAESGNPQYQLYLRLREEYGVGHSTLIWFITGHEEKGMYKDFRAGELNIENEAAVRARLEKLMEVADIIPFGLELNFTTAFLKVTQSVNYDHERMIRKLRERGEQVIRKFGVESEYLRALEEVFNYGYPARTRLY